jgi:type I restriction enzyme S subunit
VISPVKLYKETNYKETPIGKIPAEWEVALLEELVSDIKNGFASGKRDENGIVQIRMNNVTTDGRLLLDNYLKVPIPENIDEWLLKNNDFLFNNTNSIDLVGKSAIFKGAPFPCTFSNHFTRIRFKDNRLLSELALYHFITLWEKGYFRSVAIRHVGQAAVHTKYLLRLGIPLPPLTEQKKIVEVLSVVDGAIGKVDEVVAKTERLKKGLMQELLTKGIGHKEFKETEIGKIPQKWEAVKLKDAVHIDRESRDPSREMPDRAFLYVDIDSVDGGTGKIRNPREILGKEAPSRARRVIHENDVILSTVRPYLKAFAIVPREFDDQICSTGFAVLSSRGAILPYFLLIVLFSDQVIAQCNRMMVGGQYPALSQSQVSEIKIPLPPLSEQKKIADIFFSIDRKLELEKAEKEKLGRVKHGLMDLLLTGKVRVKAEE